MNRRSDDFQSVVALLLRAYQTRQKNDPGYILFFTVGIVLALTGLVLTYSLANRVEQAQAKASAAGSSGFYAAEAGLNLRAKDVKDKFLNFGYPTGTAPTDWKACTDTSSGNDGAGDFACLSYELPGQDGLTTKVPTYIVPPATDSYGLPKSESVGITSGAFKGLQAIQYKYTVTSLAMNQQGQEELPRAILGLEFNSRLVPMFQFAAFYTNDLEISPGPQMTLNGRVHTNANLFLGAGELLQVTGQVSAARSIYNKRKDNNSTFACNLVKIANQYSTMIEVLKGFNTGCSATTNAMQKNLTEPLWGDRIKFGMEPVQIPDVSFLDVTGDYYNRADLRVEYKPDNTLPIGQRVNVEPIRRTSGGATSTPLSETEKRSMFQPVIADVDACKPSDQRATLAANSNKVPAWRLMSAIASYQNPADTNNPFQLSQVITPGSSPVIWNALGAGMPRDVFTSIIPSQMAMARLTAAIAGSTATPTLQVNAVNNATPSNTADDFVQDDLVAVGTNLTYRVVSNPSSATSMAVSKLNSGTFTNQSANVGVARIGKRLAVSSSTTPIANNSPAKNATITMPSSPSNYGWTTGDQLTVTFNNGSGGAVGGTATVNITNITGNVVTVALPTPAATTISVSTGIGFTTDIRLANTNGRTLANLTQGMTDCIRPAALQQNTSFYSNRESKTMNLLQISMEGATLWNRDGVIPRPVAKTNFPQGLPFGTVAIAASAGSTSLTFASAEMVEAAGFQQGDSLKIVPNNNTWLTETYTISGISGGTVTLSKPLSGAVPVDSLAMIAANNKLFDKAPADTTLTADLTKREAMSYEALGLAASDRTEGGLVVHLTVNSNTYSAASGKVSPYGFGLTRGANLPGPLTIASDQAMYVQGDYNCNSQLGPLRSRSCKPNDTLNAGWESNPDIATTVDNIWQPAAVMADSLNVLSNQCVDNNNLLNCGVSGSQPSGLSTTIYSAFLAGVDITSSGDYNGGLENYPRFHENWGGSGGNRLFYRGSFVGLNTPQHVSGRWGSQVYTPPARRWAYDSKFDDVQNLPPLAPRFVYLKQELFVRDFKR
jgi:hypothetical protein